MAESTLYKISGRSIRVDSDPANPEQPRIPYREIPKAPNTPYTPGDLMMMVCMSYGGHCVTALRTSAYSPAPPGRGSPPGGGKGGGKGGRNGDYVLLSRLVGRGSSIDTTGRTVIDDL